MPKIRCVIEFDGDEGAELIGLIAKLMASNEEAEGPKEWPCLRTFAERLRWAKGNYTHRELSEMTGGRVSPTVISQYLNGVSEPTRPSLLALARALTVPVDWLAIDPDECDSLEGLDQTGADQSGGQFDPLDQTEGNE